MERTTSVFAFALVLLAASPALADDESVPTDRFVTSLRADFASIQSHETSFLAVGASLGLHIPITELPLGVHVMTSLTTGEGHLTSTTDLGFRYYLPMSGEDPGHTLQPYTRLGAALSIVDWETQDVTTTVGGVLGLGMQAWIGSRFGLDFEVSYRVMGGAELRQTLLGSVGVAFGI
jgi:hypothetical protein